jgi:PmbA protein
MMSIGARAIDALRAAGASHATATFTRSEKQELNAEWDEVSLLRSTSDRRLRLMALVDGGRATLASNDLSDAALERSVGEVLAQARASKPDEANAIAESSSPRSFESGPTTPDLDMMHDRLMEFLEWRRIAYPKANLRAAHFEFTRNNTTLNNSNGVDLRSSTGVYQFVATFSAKQGADLSSFNYSAWCGRDIEQPLNQVASFDRLLRQSEEQLHTQTAPSKFLGDVVITPDCLTSFLGPVLGYLKDRALIRGTSVYQDSLDERIASELLTVHAKPVSGVAEPDFFTSDGFVCDDTTIIDHGMLRSYMLSQYGANKTGRTRALNDGGGYVVEPGTTAFDDMVASIDKGVLLCRFSGGNPSDNGDFSGIAKNSYYIEGGKVRYPLGETMVSGNLVRLINDIAHVSTEHVDFGYANLPWVHATGVTVS